MLEGVVSNQSLTCSIRPVQAHQSFRAVSMAALPKWEAKGSKMIGWVLCCCSTALNAAVI